MSSCSPTRLTHSAYPKVFLNRAHRMMLTRVRLSVEVHLKLLTELHVRPSCDTSIATVSRFRLLVQAACNVACITGRF